MTNPSEPVRIEVESVVDSIEETEELPSPQPDARTDEADNESEPDATQLESS